MSSALTVHAGIYVLVLLLCVWTGSAAPHSRKCDLTSRNIRTQVDRIVEMLNTGNPEFNTRQSTFSVENECEESKCAVLKNFTDFHSCNVIFPLDGLGIINKEMKGLVHNLQMLRYLKEESCNLSAPSCPSEIKQLPLWNKQTTLQNIMACLQTQQDFCSS